MQQWGQLLIHLGICPGGCGAPTDWRRAPQVGGIAVASASAGGFDLRNQTCLQRGCHGPSPSPRTLGIN